MSFPCQGPYFTKSIKDDSGDELTIKIIGYIDKIVVLAFVNDIIDCTFRIPPISPLILTSDSIQPICIMGLHGPDSIIAEIVVSEIGTQVIKSGILGNGSYKDDRDLIISLGSRWFLKDKEKPDIFRKKLNKITSLLKQ